MDEKKRRFVRAYLETGNAAEAGRRIGLTGPHAKDKAARLLREPEIARAVERGQAARERRKLVSADRVLEELARIAFADIRDYAAWDGEGVSLKPGDAIPEEAAAAIAEISQRGGAARIRLYDKKAALGLLARHVGLLTPRAEAADPKAQRETADEARALLEARIAALAAVPDKPANGEDA